MTFAVGSLVRARGREWVVLPESEQDLLVLRPLGGTDDEVTGIHLGLEEVAPATLELPSPHDLGDWRSGRLLRDAVRLGFRNSAGPFRSFGKIACEPRPYQLVPLLVALRLDPVRILIADDVGIGKTIEACLVARELLDRGEVQRLAVLCPPHLAEQWQTELREKFNLEAELVLPGTARRLEQDCGVNQSIFDVYPYVIVSTDYIKSDRRREDFLRACPELVIVDEAHTCAAMADGRGTRHQRHLLLKGLTENPDRHLILVTATPHSGKEDAFRSLLTLIDRDFAGLPDDLAGKGNEHHRQRLAAHLVQRRRGDIEHYLDADTPFPKREEKEETYRLHPDYRKLFERALTYVRETVRDPEGGAFRQRVRWWSALALLRSIASSPAAAVDTLLSRSGAVDAETIEEADDLGRRTILDAIDDESTEGTDVAPGGDPTAATLDAQDTEEDKKKRRQLHEMAKMADALRGEKDAKFQNAKALVASLVKDGFRPIVFCRYIPTAEYVADELRKSLPRGVEVTAVTGLLPPAEREKRVLALSKSERHVLVCTDCLSEGINLQKMFDAVMHYDLAWNPTRHEQREGRVDRYGQNTKVVRVLTYYGMDNPVDGVVLKVLLRKHETIRSSLGISVPVPVDTEKLMAAIFHGSLLRSRPEQLSLDLLPPEVDEIHAEWQAAADREKLSRTLFAQHAIKTAEVAQELESVRKAVGSSVDVEWFVKEVLSGHAARIEDGPPLSVQLAEVPQAVRDAIRDYRDLEDFQASFALPVPEGVFYLHRTHPIVEGLGSYVLDTALDPLLAGKSLARRSGVARTRAVTRRTTALLLRLRFHILTRRGDEERTLLAEDWQLTAFAGPPTEPEWLPEGDAEGLLLARPEANVPADIARTHLSRILDGLPALEPRFRELAGRRGEEILEAHRRVRKATRATGVSQKIEPKLPVDMLGVYVYLPIE
jgi:superfamily II DNA or RNA helicase